LVRQLRCQELNLRILSGKIQENNQFYSVIFCEAVAIYGVIIAIILYTRATALIPADNAALPTPKDHDDVINYSNLIFKGPLQSICHVRSRPLSRSLKPFLRCLCRSDRCRMRPRRLSNSINFRQNSYYRDFRKCSRSLRSNHRNHLGRQGSMSEY